MDLIDTRMAPPVPDFELPASSGGTIRLSDLRARHPAVLLFIQKLDDASTRDLLAMYAEVVHDFRQFDAEVLAIARASVEEARHTGAELGLPYPILADHEGEVTATLIGLADHGIAVLDRFNGPQRVETASDPSGLMSPEKALQFVEGAELACPECGVAEWK